MKTLFYAIQITVALIAIGHVKTWAEEAFPLPDMQQRADTINSAAEQLKR